MKKLEDYPMWSPPPPFLDLVDFLIIIIKNEKNIVNKVTLEKI